jgi:hypothetical protein
MKPYEEINFPNGFLRWIREDGMYVCSMTEEQMVKIKALHEAPRTWVGLTDDELFKIWMGAPAETEDRFAFVNAVISKLKEKNT